MTRPGYLRKVGGSLKTIEWPMASVRNSKRAWVPFVLSLIATPFGLLIALASAGAGHGDYFWAKIIYPYTMLSTLLFGSITIPFRLLAVVQLPLYGVLLSIACVRNRLGLVALVWFALHTAAAVACFVVRFQNF
ncbi:MAG: hypothetical protein ABR555_00905 [Pyrinomonadaceae bacterium]